MNYIETIYCSQYYAYKKGGHDLAKARKNGNIFSALIIFLLVVSFCLIADMFLPHHPISRFVGRGVGHNALGRSAGKLVAAAVVLGIAAVLNFSYGSQASFDRLVAKWEQLPADTIKASENGAVKVFAVAGIAFVVSLIVWAL